MDERGTPAADNDDNIIKKKLLKIMALQPTDHEGLVMLISSHIDCYMGDAKGAAVSSKKFNELANAILKWRDLTQA